VLSRLAWQVVGEDSKGRWKWEVCDWKVQDRRCWDGTLGWYQTKIREGEKGFGLFSFMGVHF